MVIVSVGPFLIVSPATQANNNGNWHTAARWQGFLSAMAPTSIVQRWSDEPASRMVALHAQRSADSIQRFRATFPDRPIALVLTGTDVYGGLDNPQAQESLRCATHLVVLQDEALHQLTMADRAKARVIVQSAPEVFGTPESRGVSEFVAVGHLRQVKDPLTFMRAARLLGDRGELRLVHIGAALEEDLACAARETGQSSHNYRWLGDMPQSDARMRIANARALVHMSVLEGGANVVIEAIRSHVPVVASRIDGNVGLLGAAYDGYFPVGDAAALAALMRRVHDDAAFHAHLKRQCAGISPRFAPENEMRAVLALARDTQVRTRVSPS